MSQAHNHLCVNPWASRNALLLFPSQMCTPLSCSSRALVLPLMNHSSSSSTPGETPRQQPTPTKAIS